MIQLLQMAQLMHHDIIGKRLLKEQDFIVKIQVPALGTTPPSRLLASYTYSAQTILIYLIILLYLLCDNPPRRFFVFAVVASRAPSPYMPSSSEHIHILLLLEPQGKSRYAQLFIGNVVSVSCFASFANRRKPE